MRISSSERKWSSGENPKGRDGTNILGKNASLHPQRTLVDSLNKFENIRSETLKFRISIPD
jgi:hypothetical protein